MLVARILLAADAEAYIARRSSGAATVLLENVLGDADHESVLDAAISHPLCAISTGGHSVDAAHRCRAPAASGVFLPVLGRLARDRGLFSMEEAVVLCEGATPRIVSPTSSNRQKACCLHSACNVDMALAPWILYGAYGYAGSLVAEAARARGLTPILAGRDAQRITDLGARLSLPTRVFDLRNPSHIEQQLAGCAAVLHCAGPFSETSQVMLEACMRTGAHYLDITGEIDVFEAIHHRAYEVQKAGIVAMPGVGFDVVPTDCLAAMLKRALPDATHLELAFSALGRLGPGTTKTFIEGLTRATRVRRNGGIVAAPMAARTIPFADGARRALAISWGDIATAYYSTAIPNITVYMAANAGLEPLARFVLLKPVQPAFRSPPVQAVLKAVVSHFVTGPTLTQRAAAEQLLWGEACNARGQRVALQLRTPGAYALTASASLTSVATVLRDGLVPGVYTPSLAFGPDFVLNLPGVSVAS